MAQLVAVPLARLLIGTRVTGAEKIPSTGPFIVVPNHFSDVDPIVVGVAVWRGRRFPHFLAKESIFRVPVVGWFMRATHMVPVLRGKRGGADPLAAARALLAEDGGIVLYPEGTLTRDPELWPMRGKTGAARLALQTGAPVIPCSHWGDQKIAPRWQHKLRFFPRTTVDVVFGDPVDLSAWLGGPLVGSAINATTDAIMAAITELAEQQRGETAPAERWDPAAHGQSEFGRENTTGTISPS
ncbi:lysophospholipid acyltransferase family protein [Pseudolysinimonas kribbensis]|uniref:lysophospholipid acyltransferase family protein n=1 Tax=Pseudolysinimonas kribbensis TaxID=433641 RepID=UPI0031D6C42C